MSVIYCEECDKHIDTDFDVEHADECGVEEETELAQMSRLVGTMRTMTEYVELCGKKSVLPEFRGFMSFVDKEVEKRL